MEEQKQKNEEKIKEKTEGNRKLVEKILKKKYRIIILGPQGSGKGTQAELIKEHYNLLHIDMGSELRKIEQQNNELGRKIKELIDKGELVPDSITLKIFEEKLKSIENNEEHKGFISDGFPRNEKQLYLIDEEFTKELFNIALYIKISDEEAIKRISKRRICNCNGEEKIISIEEKEKIRECEKKGCKIIHREDDKEEAIKKRLELYHKQTELLLRDFYDRNILIEINGEQSIEEVFEEIKNKIKQKILL